MNHAPWRPSRPRPSLARRLGGAPRRALPVVAWLGAVAAVLSLGPLRDATAGYVGLVATEQAVVATPAAATVATVLVGLHETVATGHSVVRLADGQLLSAPLDGRVAAIHAHAGEWAAAGRPLLTIVDPTPRRILAYVPEDARSGLDVTRPMLVLRSASEARAATRIHSISPAVVRVPERLWHDPQREEWGFEIVLVPTGDEQPGERVLVEHAR